jgi:signal transduction histidine kinase
MSFLPLPRGGKRHSVKAAEKSVKTAVNSRVAGRLRLLGMSKWPLLRREIKAPEPAILSVNSPIRSAGFVRSWWDGLPAFWQAQIVGWGLFTIVDLVNQRLIYHDFSIALWRTALVVSCLVLLSTVLRRVYASPRLGNRLTFRAGAWLMLLSVGGAALVSSLVFAARQVLGWTTLGRGPLDDFVLPWTHYSLALAGWSLCYFWVHAEMAEQAEHRHAMRAEAEALRAELEELRLQLDPHFLFNALNGVAEEIPEHPAAALAMLRDLTAYLRHSLDGIKQTVVTVEAEVGGLSAYLRVQQARFGERLKATVSLDPAAASRRIASFLLQPLVENAVKHGRRDERLEIGIAIRLTGDSLQIEIENTGGLDGGAASRRRRPGIGLENVRRRLALHYPGRHRFTLGERDGADKVVAALVLEGEPCGS